MEYNEAVVDYWRDHYIDEKTKLCVLCANTGLFNITNARSLSGIISVRVDYCICKTGQAMRNAYIKGRQLGKNHYYLNLGGEIDDKR